VAGAFCWSPRRSASRCPAQTEQWSSPHHGWYDPGLNKKQFMCNVQPWCTTVLLYLYAEPSTYHASAFSVMYISEMFHKLEQYAYLCCILCRYVLYHVWTWKWYFYVQKHLAKHKLAAIKVTAGATLDELYPCS
jgi:hypothetical protein